MTTGKHIGKVLVQIKPEEDSKVVVPVPLLMQAYPRYFCNPNCSYIIAGTEHSYTLIPNSKKHTCSLSHCGLLVARMFVKCRLTDLHFGDI
jgi:hypothetical protein